MIAFYQDTYESTGPPPPPPPVIVSLGGATRGAVTIGGHLDHPRPTIFSTEGVATAVAGLSLTTEEPPMTLQDQLRGEQAEVADTGALLQQAADRIDELEALLAGSADPARIAALEAALVEIQAIVEAVMV